MNSVQFLLNSKNQYTNNFVKILKFIPGKSRIIPIINIISPNVSTAERIETLPVFGYGVNQGRFKIRIATFLIPFILFVYIKSY